MAAALEAGQRVQLFGLRASSHLNDQEAELVKLLEDKGRWKCRLAGGQVVAVRPANIRPWPLQSKAEEAEVEVGPLVLKSRADYVKHESFTADTRDHEDHSFCGIMFDINVKRFCPVEQLTIEEVWVRGALGELTVWVSMGTHEDKFDSKELWQCVYEGTCRPSQHELVRLEFDTPIVVGAGGKACMYVHSKRGDDEAIVYANQRRQISHEDSFLQVCPGVAHISPVPFGSEGAWGGWAWRPHREFVGRIGYGVRYLLWKPVREIASGFPKAFQRACRMLLLVSSRPECVLYHLPPEVVYFILNMCPHTWFGPYSDAELAAGMTAEATVDSDDDGIGWHSGNYRRLIANHAKKAKNLPDHMREHMRRRARDW